jgi:hypothetical protein
MKNRDIFCPKSHISISRYSSCAGLLWNTFVLNVLIRKVENGGKKLRIMSSCERWKKHYTYIADILAIVCTTYNSIAVVGRWPSIWGFYVLNLFGSGRKMFMLAFWRMETINPW